MLRRLLLAVLMTAVLLFLLVFLNDLTWVNFAHPERLRDAGFLLLSVGALIRWSLLDAWRSPVLRE